MNDKKKRDIIIITFSLSNNGAERVFSELANQWACNGERVTVVELVRNAFGSESFILNNMVNHICLDRKTKNKVLRYMKYIFDVREILQDNPGSSVIAYSFITQIIVAVATIGMGNELIYSERNDPRSCPYSKITRAIRTYAFFVADKCVFQTSDAMRYFPDAVQKKGSIIGNPIKAGLPDALPVCRRKAIVTAARLRPQKNLTNLITAFAMLHKQHADYSLEIYGNGEEKDKLIKLTKELGIEKAVNFEGFVNNVDERIIDAAIYVCSSDYEGISNSLLEALAMGIPCISTDCPVGGSKQIIESMYNGVLVPVNNSYALYEAMDYIIENPAEADRFSVNGRMARTQYKIENIATEWIELIDRKN